MKIRFSLRSLILIVAVLLTGLGVSIRFGPHLVWRTRHSDLSRGVSSIPTMALKEVALEGEVLVCDLNCIVFKLPRSLANTVNVTKQNNSITFSDGVHTLSVTLRDSEDFELWRSIHQYPGEGNVTGPRIIKWICEASSDEFSYRMSPRELTWHKWLLRQRPSIPNTFKAVEYRWTSDFDGVLMVGDEFWVFDWASRDNSLTGKLYFFGPDGEWVKGICTSLQIDITQPVPKQLDSAEVRNALRVESK